MPLHRVKSRVRSQGPPKKPEHGDGGRPQYKPRRTVFDRPLRSPLFSNMVDEELFQKKRVPSTEELSNLLKSNLSSSLAAEKAYLELLRAQYSQPSAVYQHIEQVQEDDDDPSASLLELAPLAYATRNHLEGITEDAIANDGNHDDEGPSTTLLATTAMYAPLTGRHGRELLPQPSLPTPTGIARSRFRAFAEEASATDSCAIEDDDEDDAAWPESSAPAPIQKATASSISSNTVHPPPLRRKPSQFARPNVRLNYPVSPPVLVPKDQDPYEPFDERLSEPIIEPAPDHKLFGTYYVVPDIFTPQVIQESFPGPSTRTTLTHPLPNEARFLDRTNTAWGKWYAKYPKPNDLPFAAAYKGTEEVTDQEVWDMHAAAHA
ncbi:hypothetical protein E8E12_010610 [Didymella heteroderae]|uniref:Uncharacterized protein n=1 Tax=Didymella heteroderae TaxID=1769908 RepID=A0A9P4WXL3_9PLEO|nr:hypothetical protein E8E12_010610 [Didymella heteroderae]